MLLFSLKRDQYINCIRKGLKQKHIKQLRQKMLVVKPQQLTKLTKLIQQCEGSNMHSLKIKICLEYMQHCDIGAICKQSYVQFLKSVLNTIHNKPQDEQLFVKQGTHRVYKILQRIIDKTIKQQQTILNSILNGCIYNIVSIMENYPMEMLMLWEKVSQIQNLSLYQYSIDIFIRTISELPFITNQAAQLIVDVFYNYSQNESNNIIQFNIWVKITQHITALLDNYTLHNSKILKISWMLLNISGRKSQTIQHKIQAIFNASNIFSLLFECLYYRQKMDKQALLFIVKVASQVFSTSSKLSYKIFQKNLSIIKYLRQLIPINIKSPKSKQPKIIITKKINYQLSECIFCTFANIVATGSQFVEMYLNSDIFILIKYLMQQVYNIKIRRGISYVLLNMVIMGQQEHLIIMLEGGLLSMLDMLVKEQLNQQIQYNSIKAMKEIGYHLRKINNFRYNIDMFKRDIDQIGTYKYIERLKYSRNQKVSNQSLQLVNELL